MGNDSDLWTEKVFYNHRVDREDSTIIILDTKLVPDFVLHACCFFIAGDRPVLKPKDDTFSIFECKTLAGPK